MTGTSDRLRYVLDGLTFPVDRWELIARAEHYGADAATLHDLHALPPRRYGSLTDVINAITDGRHPVNTRPDAVPSPVAMSGNPPESPRRAFG